jgi:hypothetical protein
MRSKLVSERIRVEFDFTSQIALGESISNPVVVVRVATGLDPEPDLMIASRKFLDGFKIFQWVIGGLPGVIYNLLCTVQGSTGKTYTIERKLAVVPAVALRPPLFGVSYSSTLYPVNAIESMFSFGLIDGGRLFQNITEDMLSFGQLTGGELKSIFVGYSMDPEAITSFGSLTAGALTTPLVTYTMVPESINSFGILISGEVKTILVRYNNYPPEPLSYYGTITGGTLT